MLYWIILVIVVTVIFVCNSKTYEIKSIEGESLFSFWDYTKHYPSWINRHPESIWPLVAKVSQREDPEGLELLLKDGSSFTIVTQMNTNFDGGYCKDIELYFNKEIVAAFRADEYGIECDYNLSYVDFIKDGLWQKKIKEFVNWEKVHKATLEQRRNKIVEEDKKKKMSKTL